MANHNPFVTKEEETKKEVLVPNPFSRDKVGADEQAVKESIINYSPQKGEIVKGDFSDIVPNIEEEFSSPTYIPKTVYKSKDIIAPMLKNGWLGVEFGVAAVNKGLVDLIDLGPNLANTITKAAGLPGEFPTFERTALGRAVTQSVVDQEKAFVPKAISEGIRFFAGGAGFAALSKLAVQGKQVSGTSSLGTLILDDLSKFSTQTEAGVAGGAATGTVLAEAISDNPLVQLAFGLGGGIGGGVVTSASKAGTSIVEQRAAGIIKERTEDISKIKQGLQDQPELAPVESANDVGLNLGFNTLLRNDMAFEAKYKNYIQQQQELLLREMEEVLGRAEQGIDEGIYQEYIATKKDLFIASIDARIKQVEEEIAQLESLGGRSINDVDQSIAVEQALARARADISAYSQFLWDQVDGSKIQINTSILKNTAEELVSEFSKFNIPSPKLVSTLERISGGKVVQTETGYEIKYDEFRKGQEILVDEDGFLVDPASAREQGVDVTDMAPRDLEKARSEWESLKRQALAGSTDSSPADARPYRILSEKALEVLSDSTYVGDTYSSAYAVARDFTRKQKQAINDGRLGNVEALSKGGMDRVPPELTGPTLFGQNRFATAAGASEIAKLDSLHKEAARGPINTTKVIEEFLMTGFQREMQKSWQDGEKYLVDYETTLRRYPKIEAEAKQALAQLKEAEGIKDGLLSQRKASQKAALYKVIDMNGRQAIRHVLNQGKPKKFAKRLTELLHRNPDAKAAFKHDLAGYAIDKMFTGTKKVSFVNAKKVIKELEPLLTSGLYTKQELKHLENALNVIEARASVLQSSAKSGQAIIAPNYFSLLAGRIAEATAISKITAGAGSIVLAGAGARAGQTLASKLSDVAVESLVKEAMLDPTVMKRLIDLDTSATAEKDFVNLVRTLFPSYVSKEDEREVEKSTSKEGRKTRIHEAYNKVYGQ